MGAFKIVYFSVIICFFISDETCNSIPHNSSVISKYARVSQWGGTDSNPGVEEGRSSNNQGASIQTITVSTKKKNPSVVYHYPVYQKAQSKVDKKTEHVPGIGEVIVQQAQDRFEARPLFAYRNKVAATYGPPSDSKAPANPPAPAAPAPAPPPVAAPTPPQPPPPPAQLPQNPPIAPPISRPASNIYDSPFTSYNPPDFKPDDSQGYQYPPFSDSPGDDPGVLSPPPAQMESSSSSPEKPQGSEDSYASLGPPLASYSDHDHDHDHEPHDYDHDYHNHVQAEDPMMMYKNNNGPPDYPPKSVDDIYYPPDFPKDQIGHDMKAESDHDAAPAFMPDHDKDHDHHHEADDMDLSPPPAHQYAHSFPDYLYDHHHYDHHVYEEIPHTTMPPAKEDKRVSSTHYSYYYLGRKLWYIPLYFSVYFIIYVTVLIVKSIARHKVNIKYKWYEHDISAKQARSLDLGSVREEEISRIYQNLSTAINNSTAKYENFTIM
ncbi:hypothetical protein GWI33_015482 [Rhynchophorus ferrugineus]|uniref:Uncharacterized protein n=1 Tax=Rhynchophorus ferrugineus TaxID=354439 RepID=A0A834I5A7_RHYFE|nr:hypothetical protein GWI33_015482 [Rhynchophorus ferrugineus]